MLLSQEQLNAACDEAKKVGLRTLVHAYKDAVGAAARAGCTQVEHGTLASDDDLKTSRCSAQAMALDAAPFSMRGAALALRIIWSPAVSNCDSSGVPGAEEPGVRAGEEGCTPFFDCITATERPTPSR